tara:strand:+ start:511 stop:813 length:303 start_codon:yes stop_codon:yes gene_type:complete
MATKRNPKPNDKPKVPDKILNDFLEDKINISTLEDISKIRASFLWEVGGIERYRIDIWNKVYKEGNLYPSTKIIHSFFVYYYREKAKLVDKTTEKNPRKL